MAVSKPVQQAGLAGVVGVVAASLIMAALPVLEGKENDPYYDSVKVLTVCYGETQVEMRRYSDAECMAMLDTSAAKYAKAVLKCVPELAPERNKPHQLAASVLAAYNIGEGAYCGSTAAKEFKRGNDAAACKALGRFNKGTFPKGVKPPKGTRECVKLADGRTRCVMNGLDNRRRAEVTMCEKGL